MEGDEWVQSPEDLSKLTLCHYVQLQHGLIVHLGTDAGHLAHKSLHVSRLKTLLSRYLLNQTEVLYELSLSLGELVYDLQGI